MQAAAAGNEELRLLLGGEAVALAALHAGISAAYSYPGTPATEIFEYIQRHAASGPKVADGGVHAAWSANEKVALEEALGASYAGRRCLVAFKHVGLNVALDPFVNAAITGVDGALVIAVADDPGMHSSQNEQDSRYLAEFAHVPCLEPASVQEAYEMTLEAFELSERVGLPVVVRLVTRLAHSRAAIQAPRSDRRAANPLEPSGRGLEWVLLPSIARRGFARLVEKRAALERWSEGARWNELALDSTLRGGLGVIAAGIGFNYFRENFPEGQPLPAFVRVATYPPPVERIRQLVEASAQVLVIEEGYPLLETSLNGLLGDGGKKVRGRLDGSLARTGDLDPDAVRAALGLPALRPAGPAVEVLPPRPPCLCDGCPHFDSIALIQAIRGDQPGTRVFGDIGCSTLSAYPPYEANHATVCMGASIGMAMGAAQAGMRPVLAMIGDSTFVHSGMTALISAAQQNIDLTVIILDNGGVAMTGGQPTLATGPQLLAIVRGLGVDPAHAHLLNAHPKDHQANLAVLRREVAHPGLSVVIANRACVLSAGA